LTSKLLGGVSVGLLQVYVFMIIAHFWEIDPGGPAIPLGFGLSIPEPFNGYITILPALVMVGLMLGALALFMSSVIKQLENFAGVMNFVIFPMFFASSSLYPLWRVKESSPLLYEICRLNPFTYAVELIRFAMYGQIGPKIEGAGIDYTNLLVVIGYTVFFLLAAIYAYNPSKGLIGRRGGPGGGGG
jgi:ABC-2 type transport system permease protein